MGQENNFYQFNVYNEDLELMEFGIQNDIYNANNEAGKKWVSQKENRAWYGGNEFKNLLKEIIAEDKLKVELIENRENGKQKSIWERDRFKIKNNVKVLVASEFVNDGGNKAISRAKLYRGAMLNVEPVESKHGKPYWDFSVQQSGEFLGLLEENNATPSTRKNKLYIINKSRPILDRFGLYGDKKNKKWDSRLDVKVGDARVVRSVITKKTHYITYEELLDKVVYFKNYRQYRLEYHQFAILPLLIFLGMRIDTTTNEVGHLRVEQIHKDYIEVKGPEARKIPITPGEYSLISAGFNGRTSGYYFVSARLNDDDHDLQWRTLYKRLAIVHSSIDEQDESKQLGKEISYFALRQAGQIELANKLAKYHFGRLITTTPTQRAKVADMVLKQFGNYDEKNLESKRNIFYALWSQGLQSDN